MVEKLFEPPVVRMSKVSVTLNGVTTLIYLDELPTLADVFSRFGLSFIVSPLDA